MVRWQKLLTKMSTLGEMHHIMTEHNTGANLWTSVKREFCYRLLLLWRIVYTASIIVIHYSKTNILFCTEYVYIQCAYWFSVGYCIAFYSLWCECDKYYTTNSQLFDYESFLCGTVCYWETKAFYLPALSTCVIIWYIEPWIAMIDRN